MRRAAIVWIMLGLGCSKNPGSGPTGEGSAAPVDGSRSLRELLGRTTRVHVRELTPIQPAIRPRIHDVVIREPRDIEALIVAIGDDQRPDPTQCPTCVPPMTLIFEEQDGRRAGTLGFPCGPVSAPSSSGTFSTPASSRCAVVSIADLPRALAVVHRFLDASEGDAGVGSQQTP